MRSSLLLLVGALLAVSDAKSAFKVRERIIPPRNWVRHGVPPRDHVISLKIGLPQANFHILEQHLYEISDPHHPRYGQHLSKDEVEALVAPHPDSLDAVNRWLDSHGIPDSGLERSPANDWVTVKVPVELAEEMLDTKYYVWKHDSTGDYLVRTTDYSLPEHLHVHIDVVQPTTSFSRPQAMRSTILSVQKAALQKPHVVSPTAPTVDPSCAESITLDCLRQLYQVGNYTPSAHIGNSIGVTAYLEEFANLADLQQFYQLQNPPAVNSSFNFVSVNGGLNTQDPTQAGIEANLDTQFAFGLTFPMPATFWSTAGSPPFNPDHVTTTNTNEPYTEWLSFILGQKTIPHTISTSYGDDEQTVPEAFAIRVCSELAQLGARGVSLTFSSGDNGVGDGNPDPATQICLTNDGKNQTKFIPLFPASCPFVTSVGGTNGIPESAVSFSGGGFSNYFPRPSYQDAAVGGFLKNELPKGKFAGLFNPGGRGIPDVAAYATFFDVVVAGEVQEIFGTSCAAPTFAGIVALLNDARIRSGKPSLGFLNPFLYKVGFEGLTDITSGNNPGCGTEGFNATKGWDPITGFGTPIFPKLKNLVLNSY